MEQKEFDDIKCVVDHNNLLVYMYFNKRFDIHTDDRDLQLGEAIIQEVKRLDLYSRKITELQTR